MMRGFLGKHKISLMLLFLLIPETGSAIGRKEFFDQLDATWKQIQTFQAQVQQESRYRDGFVQRFSGTLYMDEQGKVAYDYDLTGEYYDQSLVPGSDKNAPPPEPPKDKATPTKGSYRAQGEIVNHYLPSQGLILEAPEDENLLIQVFRSMIGTGSFDIEKFKDQHKIEAIQDTELDGIPVYRMIAQPRKDSEIYKKWSSLAPNKMVDWRQELWVEKSTFKPLKAVLMTEQESTTVRLHNPQINQPIDPTVYLIEVPQGQTPNKISRMRGDLPPAETGKPIPDRLNEIRLE